ncbi:hypothetical protein O980_00715 [Mycobacterium avium subsp. paratuberculosis 08-8281]|nr:hypothetical protein O980_00715 [Mycobacterium avium subsp. paratuberculosis 08-8281]
MSGDNPAAAVDALVAAVSRAGSPAVHRSDAVL